MSLCPRVLLACCLVSAAGAPCRLRFLTRRLPSQCQALLPCFVKRQIGQAVIDPGDPVVHPLAAEQAWKLWFLLPSMLFHRKASERQPPKSESQARLAAFQRTLETVPPGRAPLPASGPSPSRVLLENGVGKTTKKQNVAAERDPVSAAHRARRLAHHDSLPPAALDVQRRGRL